MLLGGDKVKFRGASSVQTPPLAAVANAIGASLAQVIHQQFFAMNFKCFRFLELLIELWC